MSRNDRTRRRRTPLRFVASALGWVFVLAALGAAAVPLYGQVTQSYRLLPVLSGSMEPGMYRGDMAWVEPRPADELAIGDVLVFNSPTRGSTPSRRVIHRVIELVDASRIRDSQAKPGAIYVRTQGDNNPDADPWIAAITDDTVQVRTGVIRDVGRPLLFVQNGGARALPLMAAALLLGAWGVSQLRRATAKDEIGDGTVGEPGDALPVRLPRPLVAPARPLRAEPASAGNRRAPIIAIAAVIGVTATAGAVAAAFTDTETTVSTAASGAVVLELGTSTLTADVTDLLPGESAVRAVDLRNAGSLPLSAVELTVAGEAVPLLDPTGGLQLTIERCSVPLTLGTGGDGRPTATCPGLLTPILPERPALGFTSFDLTLLTVDAPAQVDHLRVTLRVPETAPVALSGASTRIALTFTAHQRSSENR